MAERGGFGEALACTTRYASVPCSRRFARHRIHRDRQMAKEHATISVTSGRRNSRPGRQELHDLRKIQGFPQRGAADHESVGPSFQHALRLPGPINIPVAMTGIRNRGLDRGDRFVLCCPPNMQARVRRESQGLDACRLGGPRDGQRVAARMSHPVRISRSREHSPPAPRREEMALTTYVPQEGRARHHVADLLAPVI